MKLNPRETALAIGIVLLLGVLTVIAAIQSARNPAPSELEPAFSPLSSESPNLDGALILRLWLEHLGYEVNYDRGSTFTVPENTGTLIILRPDRPFGITHEEWALIDDWVAAGGTLVLAGDNAITESAVGHFQFGFRRARGYIEQERAYLPIMNSPSMVSPATVKASTYLGTRRPDYFTLLANSEGPLMVAIEEGDGLVILSTVVYPFTNAGLQESGNPEFVLNLIATFDPDKAVVFDEWHHLQFVELVTEPEPEPELEQPSEPTGPTAWLTRTAAGRALLYAAIVIFIGLILSGRQFGTPLPLREEVTRRSPLEYISAVANLSRRSNLQQYTLSRYKKNLKRVLGKRYRIDPSLVDEEFVSVLATYHAGLDTKALSDLLANMQKNNLSENTMVQLAAEAADWIEKYGS